MKNNLKKLIFAILTIALVCAIMIPVYAADVNTVDSSDPGAIRTPVHSNYNVFDDEIPTAVVHMFEILELSELLTPEG